METSEALRHRALALRAEADGLTLAYRRATWIRFSLVFFPVPFIVGLLRLELEPWHYFVAGGAYIVFSALLYVIDSRASARCDAADRAAQAAQAAADTASVTPAV